MLPQLGKAAVGLTSLPLLAPITKRLPRTRITSSERAPTRIGLLVVSS